MSITGPPRDSVDPTPTASAPKASPKRIVSEIAFPYGDLDDGVEVARALHRRFGYNCESDQLAAEMGTEPKHSRFRTQVASARIFGAVEVDRGSISLTDLGARLADE